MRREFAPYVAQVLRDLNTVTGLAHITPTDAEMEIYAEERIEALRDANRMQFPGDYREARRLFAEAVKCASEQRADYDYEVLVAAMLERVPEVRIAEIMEEAQVDWDTALAELEKENQQ